MGRGYVRPRGKRHLGLGVRSHGGDTTVVVPVPGHHDVTRVTPASSPGVLDLPVLDTGKLAVADDQDTVVQLGGRASGLVVHTSRVELEGRVRSIDGHRDGANGSRSLLQVRLRAGTNVLEASDGGNGGAIGSSLAGTVFSMVGVLGLRVQTSVVDDVLEGVSHETTVATLVAVGGGAVNQLLLGARNQGLVGLEDVGTLDGTGGGERPAASALSLVLDVGDSTVGPPVNGSGDGHVLGGLELSGHGTELGKLGLRHLGAQVELGEFFPGQISKLVHGHVVGVDTSVVSDVVVPDAGHVVRPNVEPHVLLLSRSIRLAVNSSPAMEAREGVGELLPDGSTSNGQSQNGNNKNDNLEHNDKRCEQNC
mmetsp:Transcript_101919/g.141653  ORF Transcript_101919/g.141653 Transcript_101919/m.141653 type:complete len:366 (+) Transcript_101919:136-1233(+)